MGILKGAARSGGGGAVALAGDVTGTTAASVVSELQGEVLTITGPLAAGEVIASDAGGTALVNADIATVLGYDPAANLGALGIPDPTGAPDGQVVTTASGAYGLATPSGGLTRTELDLSSVTGWTVDAGTSTGTAAIDTGAETADLGGVASGVYTGNAAPCISYPITPEEWEVRARLVTMTGGDGSARAVLDVASAASGETGVSAVSVWVSQTGAVELLTAVGSGFTSRGNVTASLPLSGTGWVRIRWRDGLVSVFYGTGTGTSAPTVWRCSQVFSWAGGSPTVSLGHMRVRMLHFGNFYGTPVSVRWADLSVVDLGTPE